MRNEVTKGGAPYLALISRKMQSRCTAFVGRMNVSAPRDKFSHGGQVLLMSSLVQGRGAGRGLDGSAILLDHLGENAAGGREKTSARRNIRYETQAV